MKVLRRILKWIAGVILIVLLLAFVGVFIAYWRSTNDCGHTAAPANPMKAVVYCDYGVANLKLEEIEKPVPSDDQILVRVRAASVNPYDWHFVEGTPYVIRAIGGIGLRKPTPAIARMTYGVPSTKCQSYGLTEAARTLTRIWSSFGTGFSISCSLRLATP